MRYAVIAALILFSSFVQAATCTEVCSDARRLVKVNAKDIDESRDIWSRRLNVKGDVIRYSNAYTAAEGLLDYMATYDRKARGPESSSAVLTHLMARCFPETHVNAQEARLAGLVETHWIARHTKIGQTILGCN